ncbi:pyridoxamine 5'-phosphate oxidase family protein [Sinomonas terrae]|uniref:Pyridoxamine 5'-phosphate oxidase family protein n=1 Tax=Sinomonas terrae TaxID=2908838 RepID=A0ABS9U7I9_9MICC|nr:pyridoxamine 5'-phosphate oxidase family protein [Sinomonas terrae]MCH6472496.1 pyridoxamine 5'-phosphate oxidase family protein [Sinomonas terrae]
MTYAAGQLDVVPTNVKAVEGHLLVRTAPGMKPAEVVLGGKAAFRGRRPPPVEAWRASVLRNARMLERRSEVEAAEAAGSESWLPTAKDVCVEIAPERVEGRQFRL